MPSSPTVCTVFVLTEDGEIRRGRRPTATRRERTWWTLWSVTGPARSRRAAASATAIRTGQSDVDPRISTRPPRDDRRERRSTLTILRKLGFRSSIVVPLHARGETTGALALFVPDARPPVRPGRPVAGRGIGGRAGWRLTTPGSTARPAGPSRCATNSSLSLPTS